MNRSVAEILFKGGLAGAAAAIPQAAVGKMEEWLILPSREDSNIAPRLVDRVSRRLGYSPDRAEEWAIGTIFHFGYGAGWGALYGLVADRFGIRPMPGGAVLSLVIYTITFPRWGGAVRLNVERPPGVRTSRMTGVGWSVTIAFGFATSILYGAMTREPHPKGHSRQREIRGRWHPSDTPRRGSGGRDLEPARVRQKSDSTVSAA